MRTREPIARRAKSVIRDLFERDISIDCFAGGAGAATGTKAATGQSVDIAINHDPVAIAVFQDNNPETECYRADVFSVDPVKACRGRHVRHLHASPDCRHHSRAKGGAPVSESVRALADVVPIWGKAVRPDVITLENVPEFLDWGPLYAVDTWKRGRELRTGPTCPGCSWKPKRVRKEKAPKKHRRCEWRDVSSTSIPEHRGEFFEAWQAKLQALGYVVEHRVLHAHHYGAHTSRKRLYLVARCDGEPIIWPAPTHGPGLKAYRTAAECIDWSLPCPSLFDRKKALATATLRRTAAGVVEFVLAKKRPYIVTLRNNTKARGLGEPLTTVTAGGTHHAIVAPSIVKVNHSGERAPESIEKPLTTVTASRRGHALVAPVLATIDQRGSKNTASAIDGPLKTIVTKNRHALIAPTLVQTSYGERKGQAPRKLDLHKPLGTVVAGGQKHALVEALLAPFIGKHFGDPKRKTGGGVVIGQEVVRPLGTITARDHHSFAGVKLAPEQIADQYPNAVKVLPFLLTYYGSEADIGQALNAPLRTITTRDRFALVCVVVDGATYVIVDLCFRMLEPHELLKAQFGKFAKGFKLDKALTKKDQVRLIGNSVVPVVMEAIVRANLGPRRNQPSKLRRAA